MEGDRVLSGGKFVALAEGGTWSTPMDDPDGGLEWRLRYMNLEQLVKDRFLAASVVECYRALIFLPVKRRNRVIAALRAAIKQQPSEGEK
jgi:hypothetical protein